MLRQQFTFYRSFWDALRALPKRDQLAFVTALCAYALDGEEKPLTGAAASTFFLAKPVLEAARRKSEGGSKSKDTGKIPASSGKDTGNKREKEGEKKGKEEKEVKGKNKCFNTPTPSDDGDAPLPGAGPPVVGVVVRAVGNLSPRARAELDAFLRDMGPDCVTRALDAAQDAGKPTWAYVRGILRRKQEQGVKCLADWDRAENRYPGTKGGSIAGTPRDVQPTPERAKRSSDWLESFLAGQESGAAGPPGG